VTPFALSHQGPTLTEQVRAVGVGVAQPAAGLAMVLAGGAFMALLAVPAYASAFVTARRHPTLRADLAAALRAEEEADRELEEADRRNAAVAAAAEAAAAAALEDEVAADDRAEPEAVTVAA
jgi:hypothetical protein